MKIFKCLLLSINRSQKRQLLLHIQGYTDDQITGFGLSPELVGKGISAWPWRDDQDVSGLTVLQNSIAEEQRSRAVLRGYTDLELADLGLSRGTIDYCVRHGRPGIDYVQVKNAA